jgi:hypothetical protein
MRPLQIGQDQMLISVLRPIDWRRLMMGLGPRLLSGGLRADAGQSRARGGPELVRRVHG